MLDRIRPHLALDMDTFKAQLAAFKELAGKPLSNAPKIRPNQGWYEWARSWVFSDDTHPSEEGYSLGAIDASIDSMHGMYKMVGGAIPRTPNGYHDQEREFTTERIHPSVFFRMEASRLRDNEMAYQPVAMKGWTRREDTENMGRSSNGKFIKRGGYVWEKLKDPKDPKSKGHRLVEWEIAMFPEGHESAEQMLLEGSWADVKAQEIKRAWEKNHQNTSV